MLLSQIQTLYDANLYEDVKILTSFALTLSEHNPDLFNTTGKCQLLGFQADAYFFSEQYKLAEAAYRNALQVRKLLTKGKGKSQSAVDGSCELDMKFRLHECYVRLKRYTEAISALESISPKQRSGKVNLALAQLYRRTGSNDRSAITAYKEALREYPLSFIAIQGLLSLGVKWSEVEQFIVPEISSHASIASVNWLNALVKAYGLMNSRDFNAASLIMKSLDCLPLLQDNVELLASLGEAYFYNGDTTLACSTLKRIHVLNPLYLPKMDLLAYLYSRDDTVTNAEREKLAVSLINASEAAPEPWVALGYVSLKSEKLSRAVYFAQKALNIDSRNVEALSLKGFALMELKRTGEAISHFREALCLAPFRFESYNNLIVCYTSNHRTSQAIACASEMCKQLPVCRSFIAYAKLLSKEPLTCDKAKTYLERAMKLDPNNSDAVLAMASLLAHQKQLDAAVKLLRTILGRSSSVRLHTLLAQCLTQLNDKDGAAEHFCKAMRLDPYSEKALAGLARLEQFSNTVADGELNVDMEGVDSSDNDEYFAPSTPPEPRIPPQPRALDSSTSDAGDSDHNADILFV